MTKPAWSKPVTQAVSLSGFPFARCVPTYVKLTIADRLGSQEPISNGLTCYARLKVNNQTPFGGGGIGTYFVHWYVMRCVSVHFHSRWTGIKDDQRQGNIVFFEHGVIGEIGPQLPRAVRRFIGKKVGARGLVQEVIRKHSGPCIGYTCVSADGHASQREAGKRV
jgi:hypothetical protein